MSVALTPPLPTPPGGRGGAHASFHYASSLSPPRNEEMRASLAIHAGLAQNGNILYDCLVSHQTRTRMPVTMSTARKRVGRPARSEAEREVKRQAILDAALEVFSEKGYAATRLDDVAARAGIAKGTIYLYVSSKQELFEELVRSGIGGADRGARSEGAGARPAGRGASSDASRLHAHRGARHAAARRSCGF